MKISKRFAASAVAVATASSMALVPATSFAQTENSPSLTNNSITQSVDKLATGSGLLGSTAVDLLPEGSAKDAAAQSAISGGILGSSILGNSAVRAVITILGVTALILGGVGAYNLAVINKIIPGKTIKVPVAGFPQ